jgi:hypothetical protein
VTRGRNIFRQFSGISTELRFESTNVLHESGTDPSRYIAPPSHHAQRHSFPNPSPHLETQEAIAIDTMNFPGMSGNTSAGAAVPSIPGMDNDPGVKAVRLPPTDCCNIASLT